ncbi:MAG: Riboflavin synthase [Acidobacteriaceae bacterium]|jgi:6,7-dimethyl-8-ribityllumazine synthase|nr:Riboflavin synthase [Acidobacteriaceae bacterium]
MKCAVITARARTEEDFELLTRMLDALGFRSRELEKYQNFRIKPFFPQELIFEVVHSKNQRVYPDIELIISDPDSAAKVVQGMGLEIVWDNSEAPTHATREFYVRLPGGTNILFRGYRATYSSEPMCRSIEGNLTATGKTFGIVVSRFNSFITERLLAGTIDGLLRCGTKFPEGYDIVRVPGAFEIPSAARTLAETKKYDAVICLGCLIRGDTAHYDVIVNECARGVGQSAQETGVPHAFGVLTCDTLEQAIDRAGLKMGNKGFEAALAAVEMANLKKAVVGQQSSALGRTKAKTRKVPRSRKSKL